MRISTIVFTSLIVGGCVGVVAHFATFDPVMFKPLPAEVVDARTTSFTRLSFECTTDAECAATPPCALKPGCDGGPDTAPYALVGYGCAGETGPIYRDEEDEFPAAGCAAIEPTWGE